MRVTIETTTVGSNCNLSIISTYTHSLQKEGCEIIGFKRKREFLIINAIILILNSCRLFDYIKLELKKKILK